MKITCKYCMKEFQGRKDSVFCSNECRIKYRKSSIGKEEQRQRTFRFRKIHNLVCRDIIYHKICPECKKKFETYDNNKKFCCRHCSATYNGKQSKNRNHSQNTKIKISESIKKRNFKNFKSEEYCRICGSPKGKCIHPEICKFLKTNTTNKVLIKIGFDKSKFGSNEVYNEFYKIRDLCYVLYNNDKLTLEEISKKYEITSPSSLIVTFDKFKIKRRNLSDALHNSILLGRFIPEFHGVPKNEKCGTYHCGWHTTWDNKQVYYRSSYELDFAKELDEKRIRYVMENLQIPYYHKIEDKMKNAIPDFYLPEKNLIIEIKSNLTYSRGEMISRFISYKKLGYEYKLILEHKDYGKRLPPTNESFYSYIKMYSPELISLYKEKDI